MARILQFHGCASLSLLVLLLVQAPIPFAQSQNPNPSNAMDNAEAIDVQQFSGRLAEFSSKLYGKLIEQKPNSNVVFSPFSIQTCAAMARIGAVGETAAQLDLGLGLLSGDVNKIAESFHKVLAAYEKSSILHIANKIYVKNSYELKDEFNSLLTKNFLSTAEKLDFERNVEAAAVINSWVAQKTNNLIHDLVAPSVLDINTRLVLINAIHFKGNWVHQFPEYATRNERFYLNEVDGVDVPMMNLKERLRYANLPQLDAAALELRYKDSDLSMLVVLPNSKTGLAQLEQKLSSTPLSQITEHLYDTQVIVKLPKFKAEFQVELTPAFKELGMTRLFTNDAEFDNMLQSKEELKVSAIIHKAFIDVNEKGTEAAAATAAVVRMKRSIITLEQPPEFHADHPFIYVLAHRQQLPLFWGAVLRLDGVAATSQRDEL